MAPLLGRPAADPVDPGPVALAEHPVDEPVVGGQVVLGQEADLERRLGHAGQARLVRRPRLLVEVATEAVRDVVVREPLLGDLGVAVVQAAGLGLQLDEQRPVGMASASAGRAPGPARGGGSVSVTWSPGRCCSAVPGSKSRSVPASGRCATAGDRCAPAQRPRALDSGAMPEPRRRDRDPLRHAPARGRLAAGPRRGRRRRAVRRQVPRRRPGPARARRRVAGRRDRARASGCSVPEIVLIDVDPGLGDAEPDEELQDLVQRSGGLNLGLDFLPGALTFNPAAAPEVDPDARRRRRLARRVRDQPRPQRRPTRTCSSGTVGPG